MSEETWPENVKSVFLLCHPHEEKKRFQNLIPHLLMRGIPGQRIKVSAPTWGTTLDDDIIFKVYDPFLKRGTLPALSFKSPRLSKGEISLILNFFSAIKTAAADLSDNECIILFESDVFLRRDFVPRLNDIFADLSGQEWDYISLSEGVGTRPPGCPSSYYCKTTLNKPPHQWVFRCVDSVILHKRFIDNLAKTLIPFNDCLDWELNFQIMLHGGKALWADPPLVEQGTCYNRMATTLD